MNNKLYDIFISHAWRYHNDWIRMGELFDKCTDLEWRNFSVPWHDPAMSPHTDVGGRFIRNWLESQIAPVYGIILLNSVYETKSSRKWVLLEVEMARRHNKPVVAVPTYGNDDILPEVQAMSDQIVGWDCHEIVRVFNSLNE